MLLVEWGVGVGQNQNSCHFLLVIAMSRCIHAGSKPVMVRFDGNPFSSMSLGNEK